MKIVVLGGGDSTEREVSLRSAGAVSKALVSAGFETVNLDPINLEVLDSIHPNTIVFPILHGNNCEDGKIQGELEARNMPFLGSDSKSSEVCFDKGRTRQAFQDAELPIAMGDIVTSKTYRDHPLNKQPHVLKVNEGGSSIGTYLVFDPINVSEQKIKEVFKLGKTAVIEELVEGVEITVPVLDGAALPVIEIIPPANEEFDYLNKYNGKTQENCPPTLIDGNQQKQAQKIAEKAHETMDCRHLSRTDIIVRPSGEMILLEINTMPGMTDQSLYPKSAKAAGIEFPDLVAKFVELVKRDYGL
jgi:D-alanine-D-alanine ligase